MHRAERLINLVGGPARGRRRSRIEEFRLPLPGYAENDAAFRRAFERDKEALRELGVPWSTEPRRPPHPDVLGYRAPKEAYYLRDPGLEPDELAALHLAALGGAAMEGAEGVAALLEARRRAGRGGTGAAVASVAVAALPGADHLAVLFAAISARRPVELHVPRRGPAARPVTGSRSATAYWYLAGLDHGARRRALVPPRSGGVGGPRRRATAAAFEPRRSAGRAAAAWEMGSGDAVAARLLVDADQAGLGRRLRRGRTRSRSAGTRRRGGAGRVR